MDWTAGVFVFFCHVTGLGDLTPVCNFSASGGQKAGVTQLGSRFSRCHSRCQTGTAVLPSEAVGRNLQPCVQPEAELVPVEPRSLLVAACPGRLPSP